MVLETLLGLVTTVQHKSSSGLPDSYYQRKNNREQNKFLSVLSFLFVKARVAERLTPGTPDPEVRGSNLARRFFPLGKELYTTLSLFTQVYKWVPATYCWGGGRGVTLRWISIPSRGE